MDLSKKVFTTLPNRSNYTLEAGLILQKFHNILRSNNLHKFYNKPQPTQIIIPENGKAGIDAVIDIEMINIKNNYQQEENLYVEKMLVQHPPNISARRNPRESEIKDSLQQQKAESCRRSRLNGKIKKAKTRFRHEFISEKLSKSAHLLRCIQDVIEHAENKLIQGDFDRKVLDELRRNLGMNRNITDLLDIQSIIDNNNKNNINNNNNSNSSTIQGSNLVIT